MRLSYSIIDAFASEAFSGNPAAVFVLEGGEQLDDRTLQLIAREINFSETAFAWPLREPGHYRLRWMMPQSEAPICGHATLATSHALFQRCPKFDSLTFETLAGTLHAHKIGDKYELDFPADPGVTPLSEKQAAEARSIWLEAAPRLEEGRIVSISRDMSGTICCVELSGGLELRELPIRSSVLAPLDRMVTSGPWNVNGSQKEASQIKITCRSPAGSGRDFDSRVLCPTDGIDEDPVTGSAHCSLAPFWKAQMPDLGTAARPFKAFQASARGGHLEIVLEGDRCKLRGQAVNVAQAAMTF